MSDMSQQYISLADGTLSPDQRVNYESGLVLGVSEFRQEQEYFLEKDYLFGRALHGYGTVSGLKVMIQPPSDKPDDLMITVEPGMALDQQGRSIVVRNALCARLAAWLANQDQDKAHPDNVATHLDTQGNGHVYIVASYTSYLDALVPLPGQPCSSCDTTQAPSRIHDSYDIELRWDPPTQPTWDAEHCFASLMSRVRFLPEFPYNLSDEQNIIKYIRALDQPCPEVFPGILSERFLYLPAVDGRGALDRIFNVWVTEMRPKLSPTLLTSNTGEPAVLLARVDFVAQKAATPGATWSISSPQLNEEGRPFLLDTQLMQKLFLQKEEAEPAREFATAQVVDSNTVQVWVHHPNRLVINPTIDKNAPQQITLQSDGTALTISNILAVGNLLNVFTITVVEQIASGVRLEMAFVLNMIQAENAQTKQQQLLQVDVDTVDFTYIGHDRIANVVTVYPIAGYISAKNNQGIPSSDVATMLLHLPVQPFVTITPIPSTAPAAPAFELWFHLDTEPTTYATFFKNVPAMQILVETAGNSTLKPINYSLKGNPQPNIFIVQPDDQSWPKTDPIYLRFAFTITGQDVAQSTANQTIPLEQYIAESGIKFAGDNGKGTILAYVRVSAGGK